MHFKRTAESDTVLIHQVSSVQLAFVKRDFDIASMQKNIE